MAIVVTSLGHNQSSAASSLAVTTAAAVAAHDLLLIPWHSTSVGTTVTSITTTAGDSGFLQTTPTGVNPVMGLIWLANAIGMASSSTVTVNFSAGQRCAICPLTVSGMSIVAANVRYAAGSPGTTTGTNTSTSLTSNALGSWSSLALAVLGNSSTAPGTITQGAGWTSINPTTATCFLQPFYQVVTGNASPVTFAPSWVNSVLFRAIIYNLLGAQTVGFPSGTLTGVGG